MNRIRNTFTKKAPNVGGFPPVNNENARPSPYDQASPRSSYTGSRTSSSISIKRKEEPPEYKLSGKHGHAGKIVRDADFVVVIDGNVYLPVCNIKGVNAEFGVLKNPTALSSRKEEFLARVKTKQSPESPER